MLLSSLFPSIQKLESRYSYLKKYPYFLPVAWCQRIWNYSKEIKETKDNNAVDALKIGNERIELMRQYGIIK